MLVQRTVAQGVEHGAGPHAAQQANGTKAIGNQGDEAGLEADQLLVKSGFAAGGLNRLGKPCQWHDVAVDEARRDGGAQEGAWIVG